MAKGEERFQAFDADASGANGAVAKPILTPCERVSENLRINVLLRLDSLLLFFLVIQKPG